MASFQNTLVCQSLLLDMASEWFSMLTITTMASEVLSDFQGGYRSTGYNYRRVLAVLYARCVCYCGQHVMCVVFRMSPIIAFKCSWLLQHYIPPSSLSHAWISLIGSIFAFQSVSACMHHQFTNCVIKFHNDVMRIFQVVLPFWWRHLCERTSTYRNSWTV